MLMKTTGAQENENMTGKAGKFKKGGIARKNYFSSGNTDS